MPSDRQCAGIGTAGRLGAAFLLVLCLILLPRTPSAETATPPTSAERHFLNDYNSLLFDGLVEQAEISYQDAVIDIRTAAASGKKWRDLDTVIPKLTSASDDLARLVDALPEPTSPSGATLISGVGRFYALAAKAFFELSIAIRTRDAALFAETTQRLADLGTAHGALTETLEKAARSAREIASRMAAAFPSREAAEDHYLDAEFEALLDIGLGEGESDADLAILAGPFLVGAAPREPGEAVRLYGERVAVVEAIDRRLDQVIEQLIVALHGLAAGEAVVLAHTLELLAGLDQAAAETTNLQLAARRKLFTERLGMTREIALALAGGTLPDRAELSAALTSKPAGSPATDPAAAVAALDRLMTAMQLQITISERLGLGAADLGEIVLILEAEPDLVPGAPDLTGLATRYDATVAPAAEALDAANHGLDAIDKAFADLAEAGYAQLSYAVANGREHLDNVAPELMKLQPRPGLSADGVEIVRDSIGDLKAFVDVWQTRLDNLALPESTWREASLSPGWGFPAFIMTAHAAPASSTTWLDRAGKKLASAVDNALAPPPKPKPKSYFQRGKDLAGWGWTKWEGIVNETIVPKVGQGLKYGLKKTYSAVSWTMSNCAYMGYVPPEACKRFNKGLKMGAEGIRRGVGQATGMVVDTANFGGSIVADTMEDARSTFFSDDTKRSNTTYEKVQADPKLRKKAQDRFDKWLAEEKGKPGFERRVIKGEWRDAVQKKRERMGLIPYAPPGKLKTAENRLFEWTTRAGNMLGKWRNFEAGSDFYKGAKTTMDEVDKFAGDIFRNQMGHDGSAIIGTAKDTFFWAAGGTAELTSGMFTQFNKGAFQILDQKADQAQIEEGVFNIGMSVIGGLSNIVRPLKTLGSTQKAINKIGKRVDDYLGSVKNKTPAMKKAQKELSENLYLLETTTDPLKNQKYHKKFWKAFHKLESASKKYQKSRENLFKEIGKESGRQGKKFAKEFIGQVAGNLTKEIPDYLFGSVGKSALNWLPVALRDTMRVLNPFSIARPGIGELMGTWKAGLKEWLPGAGRGSVKLLTGRAGGTGVQLLGGYADNLIGQVLENGLQAALWPETTSETPPGSDQTEKGPFVDAILTGLAAGNTLSDLMTELPNLLGIGGDGQGGPTVADLEKKLEEKTDETRKIAGVKEKPATAKVTEPKKTEGGTGSGSGGGPGAPQSGDTVTVAGCRPMTVDPDRDARLASKGPRRVAKGTFRKNFEEGGHKTRTIEFSFYWEPTGERTPLTGHASYYLDQRDVGILAKFEAKGTETIREGKFEGGHGGRFEGWLVDNEDGGDGNRVTGLLCADGRGKIVRHRSKGRKETWTIEYPPFPLTQPDLLQGNMTIVIDGSDTLYVGKKENAWGDPRKVKGSLGLTVNEAAVTVSVDMVVNTEMMHQDFVLFGTVDGVYYRDGRMAVAGKVPLRAADVERCRRTVNQPDKCTGEAPIWLLGRRDGARFKGRWAIHRDEGRWASSTGEIIPLPFDQIRSFDEQVASRIGTLKGRGDDPTRLEETDWGRGQ